VGLGLSAGAWCNVLLLLLHVNGALRTEGKDEGEGLRKFSGACPPACLVYLAAALVMAFCLILLAEPAQDMSLLALPILILVAVALWFAGFLAFRNEDARALARLFRRD
jgi:putative copper export protein